MEMEQVMGLNEWTRDFLAIHSAKMEKSGQTYMGILSIPYYLNKYTLLDGRILHEKIQAEIAEASNRIEEAVKRIIFIALRDQTEQWIPESLWTRESISMATL